MFLDQGWNPCLWHWQVVSLPLSTREAQWVDFKNSVFCPKICKKNPFPGLLVELSLDLLPGITVKDVDQRRDDQAWETLKPEVVGMTGDDSAARA